MDAIEYFKGMRERLCEEYLKVVPKDSVAYQATLKEKEFYDEAIKALEQEPQFCPPCEDCNTKMDEIRRVYDKLQKQESCEDCISRKVVLDKIKEVCFSREQEWIDFRVSQGSNGQRDLIINFIEDLPSVLPKLKTNVLDRIRVEIGQTTSRYTISRERGAMGQVEWSDRLIKENEVLEILDKYREDGETD